MEESSYRFVILFTYVAASLVNNIPMNTFSSTATIVKNNFDLPPILISLNYLICPISHAIMAFPINWMLTKKGIRFSYYLGAAVMVAGVWLRTTLTEGNPYLCLLGSFMSGGSGLVIMNSASKITLNWFRADMLTVVTFITVLTSLVSIAAGLFVPAFLVNAASNRDDFMAFLRFEAILITVPFLLLAIFIREKPKIPPSKAAEV